jgi:hypothetical protein
MDLGVAVTTETLAPEVNPLASGPIVYGAAPPVWMQPAPGDAQICYSAQNFRSLIGAVFTSPGVINNGDFNVTQNGNGDPTCNVAIGTAVIAGTTIANQGSYLVYNPAAVNVQPPSQPVTYQRYDIICLVIEDGQITNTHNYRWSIQAIAGQEAATPVIPATPNDAILLATILRSVGGVNIITSMITNVQPHASNNPLAVHAPDANALTHSGFYYIGTGDANTPSTTSGSLLYVAVQDANNQTQMAMTLAAPTVIWTRALVGGVWGSWIPVTAPSRCTATHAATQNVLNAAWTGLTMTKQAYPKSSEPDGIFTITGAQVKVPTDGFWSINCAVQHASATGRVGLRINNATAGVIIAQSLHAAVSGVADTLSGMDWLAAGTAIEMDVYQDSLATRSYPAHSNAAPVKLTLTRLART